MHKLLKRAFLGTCRAAGAFDWAADSAWRRQRLAILCYHGVSIHDEHEWDPRYYVAPATLEARFRQLREGGYAVLPLEEGTRRLSEGTLPPKAVAITFDDGCYDFYKQALPLLIKYRLPATVYLTTFYCSYPKPVFNMFCFYLLWKARDTFRNIRLLDLDLHADLTRESGRQSAGIAIMTEIARRGLTLEQKDAFAEDLAGALGVDYSAIVQQRILQLMTPAEVAAVSEAGVDIQLHTHRHRTPGNRELFLREIRDNRAHISKMIGPRETHHFCYPSGVCSPEFLPWLEEQGITSATTCEPGLASPEDHPLLQPRVTDTQGLTAIEFESWLTGFGELIHKLSGRTRRTSPDSFAPLCS